LYLSYLCLVPLPHPTLYSLFPYTTLFRSDLQGFADRPISLLATCRPRPESGAAKPAGQEGRTTHGGYPTSVGTELPDLWGSQGLEAAESGRRGGGSLHG